MASDHGDAFSFARPAQERANTGDKFVHLERLAKIIVRPAVQAIHEHLRAVARGENENGPHVVILAHGFQERHAIRVGKAQIENERLVIDAEKSGFRVACGLDEIDRKASVAERGSKVATKALIILRYEKSHGHLNSGAAPSAGLSLQIA